MIIKINKIAIYIKMLTKTVQNGNNIKIITIKQYIVKYFLIPIELGFLFFFFFFPIPSSSIS